MDVCIVCVYSVFVLFCVCSGLATVWSPVQGVLPTVYWVKKPKKRPRPNEGLYNNNNDNNIHASGLYSEVPCSNIGRHTYYTDWVPSFFPPESLQRTADIEPSPHVHSNPLFTLIWSSPVERGLVAMSWNALQNRLQEISPSHCEYRYINHK
jgi:hypothetical protein